MASSGIVIINSCALIRIGLRSLISSFDDLNILAESDRARGTADLVHNHAPDLIILDLVLADGSGYDLIRDIRSSDINVPILIISQYPENEFAERAFAVGATGYLPKDGTTRDVIRAIHQLLRGEMYASPAFAQRMVHRLAHRQTATTSNPLGKLSDREFEVLQLISEGLPPRLIGKRLSISPKTVEAHRSHIRAKLGIKNGAELVRFAIRQFETQLH